jgi:hypothetical protein
MTVRAADPGESALRIAAVEIALDDLLDDRPEKTVLSLETLLIFGEESVEMMENKKWRSGASQPRAGRP